MMFSSNQVLEISGNLSSLMQLKAALEFALMYSGKGAEIGDIGFKILYQITEDGKYCIGWGCNNIPEGWTEFPSETSIFGICKGIERHLNKFPFERGNADGMYNRGFIMKRVEEYLGSEYDGIKNPFYGIVYFQPFTCFYSR